MHANETLEIRHRTASTLGLAVVSLLVTTWFLWMLLDGGGDVEVRPQHALIGLAVGAGGAGAALAYLTRRAAILSGLATAAVVTAMTASPTLVLPLVTVLLFGGGGVLTVGQRLVRPVAMRVDTHGVTWQPSPLRAPVTAPWDAVDGFSHERMHANNVVVVLGNAAQVPDLKRPAGLRAGVLAWVMVGQDRATVARFVDEANAALDRSAG